MGLMSMSSPTGEPAPAPGATLVVKWLIKGLMSVWSPSAGMPPSRRVLPLRRRDAEPPPSR
eukprot:1781715-Pyramimonas_sp.AAC.1